MYLSVGYGPGIYATLDVVGWGRYWQFLGEDCTNRDFNLPRHIVPDVVSQPRADYFDPAVPWGGVHPSHQVVGPEGTGGNDVPEAPQHPEVKHEDGDDEDNPTDEAEQGTLEITRKLEPKVSCSEMVGVEEGGDDKDAVDYDQGADPVPDEVGRVEGRVSRSRAWSIGLDPLHDPKEEPQSTWDANRNLILRPRGEGWTSPPV